MSEFTGRLQQQKYFLTRKTVIPQRFYGWGNGEQ